MTYPEAWPRVRCVGHAIGQRLVSPDTTRGDGGGLPVIATRSGGFPSMINLDPRRSTGWLVVPDDTDALADAMLEAVDQPGELVGRGEHALAHACAELSWAGRVAGFEHAYPAAQEHRRRTTAGS